MRRPTMLTETERTEIIAAARRGAHDYYLSALLAPKKAKDDLLVLAAFEGELRRISETIGDPILAEIRLQWWRDAVSAMADMRQSGHPVADALARLVTSRHVSAASLHKSIDARSAETGTEPIATEQDLDSYLDRTDGAALARAVAVASTHIAVPEPRPALVQAAGRCVGLSRILLDLSWRRESGRPPVLPGTTARAITQSDVHCQGSDATEDIARLEARCREYADRAGRLLREVRGSWAELPRWHRAALGPVALVGPYLKGLQRVGCHAPHPGGVISPVSRVARLWWAVRFARL
ncbi:MAG: squalene/phytoene synthase family protein [Hyphomicrobiaceae bacterium]